MKASLTFLVALMTITFSFGQKVSIGSEVGIITSINSGYGFTDIKNSRTTYYSGFNFNYRFNNRVTLSTGFHYLKQGFLRQPHPIFESIGINQLVKEIDYVTMQVSANVHFLKSRKLVTTFGLLGTFNKKSGPDFLNPLGTIHIRYVPDFSRNNMISASFGVGYKIFENKRLELIPGIKYYQGLTNTFNDPYIDSHSSTKRRFSSILLSVNFNYKF